MSARLRKFPFRAGQQVPSVRFSESPPCSPVIGDIIAEKKPKKPLHVMQ